MGSCYTRQQGINTIPHLFLVLSLLFLTLPPTLLAQTPPDSRDDMYNNYARFSPSMAIIIVVLVGALFFMAFFSIYIRHCSESSGGSTAIRRAGAAGGGGLGRSRRLARGLDASVIETFPTFVYSTVKGLKIGKGALECAVCLNEFEDDETLRLLPKCDHVFHPECIDAWLASHVTCPVCRANLVPQPGESVAPTLPGLGTEPVSNPDEELGSQDPEQQRCEPDNGPRLQEGIDFNATLNRTRTRGSRSNRMRWFPFPRSHSTGHSLVQPGESTERFTLRLPAEVRKQVVNRKLNRALSLVVLPREGSSRKGYRTGGGDGSSRGKSVRRIDRSDRSAKSDRWVFNMVPPFLSRALSFQSHKVAAHDGEGTSMAQPAGSEAVPSNEPPRLPV